MGGVATTNRPHTTAATHHEQLTPAPHCGSRWKLHGSYQQWPHACRSRVASCNSSPPRRDQLRRIPQLVHFGALEGGRALQKGAGLHGTLQEDDGAAHHAPSLHVVITHPHHTPHTTHLHPTLSPHATHHTPSPHTLTTCHTSHTFTPHSHHMPHITHLPHTPHTFTSPPFTTSPPPPLPPSPTFHYTLLGSAQRCL